MKKVEAYVDELLSTYANESLSAAEVGKLIGYSRQTVNRMIATGEIPAYTPTGRNFRILKFVVKEIMLKTSVQKEEE